jgi:hypothetical protein
MAFSRHCSDYTRCYHLSRLSDICAWSNRKPRDSEVAHLEEETVGMEYCLDGACAVSCDCFHDYAGDEASFWKTATGPSFAMQA